MSTQDKDAVIAQLVEACRMALALAETELVDFKKYGLKCDDDIATRIRAALRAADGLDDDPNDTQRR